MKLWIDAQFSPAIARWITANLEEQAVAVRDVGLRSAKDRDIFFAARKQNAVVLTKDSDFVELLERNGVSPQVVWVTCGNTSNKRLQEILTATWKRTKELLEAGESLVEITGDLTEST